MHMRGLRARQTAAAAAFLAAAMATGRPSAAGDAAGRITPENAATVKQAAAFSGHKGPVFGLAASPDGTLLASAGIDGTARLWDVKAGKAGAVLAGHKRQVIAVGFRADGATLLSAGYEPSVRLWNVKSGKEIEAQTENPKDPLQRVSISNVFVVFSPGAGLLAATPDGGYVVNLWDTEQKTGAELPQRGKSRFDRQFRRAAFSADGRWMAVQCQTGEDKAVVEVWDRKASAWGPTLEAADRAFVANEGIAISPDGSTVASVDVHSSTIQLWETKTGKRTLSLSGHTHDAQSEQLMISGLEFSPDGRLLASASYDKTVRLWDVATGKSLASLASHGTGAAAVAWSPDGRWLASSDLDGSVQVWSLPGP